MSGGSGTAHGTTELRNVALNISRQLALSVTASLQSGRYILPDGVSTARVLVSPNYLTDPRQGVIFPFSSYFSVETQSALLDVNRFDVITGMALVPHLYLTCTYYQVHEYLNIACDLQGDVTTGETETPVFQSVATGSSRLSARYWDDGWFVQTPRDKMYFLMQKLEEKSFNHLVVKAAKPRVQINPFRFQNTRTFSPFSDYISQYAMDYFTRSGLMIPVVNVEQALEKYRANTRSIEPHSVPEGNLAALVDADYFVEGSYWHLSPQAIEVRCKLRHRNGDILASESIPIDRHLISPEMLIVTTTQLPDPRPSDAPSSDAFTVSLHTQKGRDRLNFTVGENIFFLINTSEAAHIRLFNRGADGKVYQIYPNHFAPGDQLLEAGEVISIPNQNYPKGFRFMVGEPTGRELVKVVASSKPLPQLSGTDLGDGIRQMHQGLPEIEAAYRQHARNLNIRMASDVIEIITRRP